MTFPVIRPRRVRRTAALRQLVRETTLDAGDLILPLFVTTAATGSAPIASLPGHAQLSQAAAVEVAHEAAAAGVGGVLLFGLPDAKDAVGSEAWAERGAVQRAAQAISAAEPELAVITDVCLCQYTDHGHCGVLDERGDVRNDDTLELLARVAISHVAAGAHVVAPSDMMDGRVGAMRGALDDAGHERAAIMSYSTKFASAFYGPFRDAAGSSPGDGDRRGYQLDPANAREALRESLLDEHEGADMLMVKPALTYLDLVAGVRAASSLPLAAYHVSGEYAMVKAAAERGWLNERDAQLEALTSIRRAGADMIITYAALEAAAWLARAS